MNCPPAATRGFHMGIRANPSGETWDQLLSIQQKLSLAVNQNFGPVTQCSLYCTVRGADHIWVPFGAAIVAHSCPLLPDWDPKDAFCVEAFQTTLSRLLCFCRIVDDPAVDGIMRAL